MANKPRPDCPVCNAKMAPLFRKAPRGESFIRAGSAFMCIVHPNVLANGRGNGIKYAGAPPVAVTAAVATEPNAPTRRGRPPGSKNKPKPEAVATATKTKKRLGRPPGSKNKVKTIAVTEATPVKRGPGRPRKQATEQPIAVAT